MRKCDNKGEKGLVSSGVGEDRNHSKVLLSLSLPAHLKPQSFLNSRALPESRNYFSPLSTSHILWDRGMKMFPSRISVIFHLFLDDVG